MVVEYFCYLCTSPRPFRHMSLETELLQKYWGYTTFRPLQHDIIKSILAGKDTLGLMPTGGGKSITFQVPALCKEGLCLVITPLIALMKDQVQNLKQKGIKAVAIYSGMTREEIIVALENCIFGNYKFLYISPERLDTDIFRTKLRSMTVNMIAVDESHCISQWGYDFRPAYLKIADVRKLLPHIPILALTATATPDVVKDIQRQLQFTAQNVFRTGFERQNLAYIVRQTVNKEAEMIYILRRIPGSSIVYVRNRGRTKEIAEALQSQGITAAFYHAGVNNDLKDQRQRQWQSGECRVMVATNAFGMGIDKPDVRTVIHIDLPDSPEAYFQEAGRAGRDGADAFAYLLHTSTDTTYLHRRITDTFPDKSYIKTLYEHLNYYYQMAMGDGAGCMFEFNLEDFCRQFHYFPVPADSALKILTRAGYIEYTGEQDNASRLIFTVRRDELYKLHANEPQLDQLIQILLRTYTALFTDYIYINEDRLAFHARLTREQIYQQLITLSQRRIISYIPRKKTPYIIYTRERVELRHLHLTNEVYEQRKERYQERINAMIQYINTNTKCRSNMLLRYFGEENSRPCGKCDICQSTPNKATRETIAQEILQLLGPQNMRLPDVAMQLSHTDPHLLSEVIRQLLDQGKLTTDGFRIQAVNADYPSPTTS